MDLATQTHLTKMRDLLTFRLLELRAEVHSAEQAQRELTDASASGSGFAASRYRELRRLFGLR